MSENSVDPIQLSLFNQGYEERFTSDSIIQANLFEEKESIDHILRWKPIDPLVTEVPYVSHLEPIFKYLCFINDTQEQDPLLVARSRWGRILIDLYRIGELPPNRESLRQGSHSREFLYAILDAFFKGHSYKYQNDELDNRDLRIRNDIRNHKVRDRIIRSLDGSYNIVTVTGKIQQIESSLAEYLMSFSEMDYYLLQSIAVNLFESVPPIPLRSGISDELVYILQAVYSLAKSDSLPDEMAEARGLILSAKRYFKILFCGNDFRSLASYHERFENVQIVDWVDEVIRNGVRYEGIINSESRESSRLQLELSRFLNSGYGRDVEARAASRIIDFTGDGPPIKASSSEVETDTIGLHTDQFKQFEGIYAQDLLDCAKRVIITYAFRIITHDDPDLLPFYIDPSHDLIEIITELMGILDIDIKESDFLETDCLDPYEKYKRFATSYTDSHTKRLHRALAISTSSKNGWILEKRSRHEDHHDLLLEYLLGVYRQLITPTTRINNYLLSYYFGDSALKQLERWKPPSVFTEYKGLKTHIPTDPLSLWTKPEDDSSEIGDQSLPMISAENQSTKSRSIPDLILIKSDNNTDADREYSIDEIWRMVEEGNEFAIVEIKYLEGGDGQKVPNGATEATRFQIDRYLDAIYKLFYEPYGLKLSKGVKVKPPRIFNVIVTPFNITTYEFNLDPSYSGWRVEKGKHGKPKVKKLHV